VSSPDRASWQRPLLVGALTTLAVTLASRLFPETYAATAVGLVFLGATYAVVLRADNDQAVRHHGLSLGGVLERAPLEPRRVARAAARATAWAVGVAAVVLPPFWIGYVWWYRPHAAFAAAGPGAIASDIAGQLLVIALPEEAFFRGYLQTRLDDAWGAPWRVLGARLGPSWLVTSALFAVGHLLTEAYPGRLAVFFPALLFGWLRARTGGIGAALVLHALCNLFASYLAASYGLGG
jgi:uncharacterized protein